MFGDTPKLHNATEMAYDPAVLMYSREYMENKN